MKLDPKDIRFAFSRFPEISIIRSSYDVRKGRQVYRYRCNIGDSFWRIWIYADGKTPALAFKAAMKELRRRK